MDEQDIVLKFEKLSNLIRFFTFEPESVAEDITKSEMKTLLQLRFKSNQSLSYYSHKVGLKKGSFTSLTDGLEEKGYIVKSFLENNRRVKTIFLSSKGKILTETFYQSLHEHLNIKLQSFSQKDLVLIESAINILQNVSFEN